MKRISGIFKTCLTALFAVVLCFGTLACEEEYSSSSDSSGNSQSSSSAPEIKTATITVEADKTVLKKGETAKLTIAVKDAVNSAYTITVDKDKIVAVENETLSVIADVKVDTIVHVVVTLNEDVNVKASKTFTIIAPVIEGQVGELTSDMLAALGNKSITVKGALTDYYNDFNQSFNSTVSAYDMTVKMDDGAWLGSWNVKDDINNVVSDNYRIGANDGVKDQYGNVGHALEKLYIDKNNKVARVVQKDYLSVPAVWEAQHLWNHLANLQINKFTYDAENEVYVYGIDEKSEDDLYLMTYLSYSLTPMLEDTLASLYLRITDGKISGLLGQTEIINYGEDAEHPDANSYTTVEVVFSDVGTTVVDDPAPFEADENADKLKAALSKMGGAKNYTFRTTDVQTYAPETDSGDYEVSGEKSVGALLSTSAANNTSSTGTVGCFGRVTEEAVLIANTMKYNYTMDGKDYKTDYSGYKQVSAEAYDEFAYDGTVKALVGKKQVKGNIFDNMPAFEFSADIFKFVGMSVSGGKNLYKFALRETAITVDIATEICAYKYATSAAPSASRTLTITVDDNGNIVSTMFPYSISSGTYMGYCTTVYSDIGSTVLPADTFEGYVAREIKTQWSQYVTDYSTTFSTQDKYDENVATVLAAIYGDAAVDVPAPTLFFDVLGDNFYGPFYNWKAVGTDTDGNDINHGYLELTASSSEYDSNTRILNYDELMAQFKTELGKLGFALSPANTDTTGGESGMANRYVCFIKNDVQIVIENNGTKHFWIYLYKTGDWTLNK